LPQIGLKILSVGLFEKDGKRWLKLPQREFESGGERKFSSLIEFASREAHDKFQRPALAALDAFIDSQVLVPGRWQPVAPEQLKPKDLKSRLLITIQENLEEYKESI